jgi:hypothetical protein
MNYGFTNGQVPKVHKYFRSSHLVEITRRAHLGFTPLKRFDIVCLYWMHVQQMEGEMSKTNKQSKPAQRQERSGMERLGLRVSEMINHPVAQIQRWVTIHRLDTDGDREWEEVMGLLSETDGIDMTLNDDESVTLRWEASAAEDHVMEVDSMEAVEEAAPF